MVQACVSFTGFSAELKILLGNYLENKAANL
jgi:hypothetical protein